MSVALPDQLDPWRAVKSGLCLQGSLRLAELPRVWAAVVTEEGRESSSVEYRLSFERNARGLACVRGWIRTQLRLQCQRCLGGVSIPVDSVLAVALQASERGLEDLDSEMDPWVVEDDRLDPRELIEDELLLAIPVVPRHEPGECRNPDLEPEAAGLDAFGAASTAPESPFAVLAGLKGGKRDA